MDEWDELRQRYPWPAKQPEVNPNGQGWCHGDVVAYFRRFLGVETRLVLELGSWLGLSSRHILSYAPNTRLICVDHWKGSREHHKTGRKDIQGILPVLHETFLRNMWKFRDRVIPMRTTTQEALPEIQRLGLQPELVFVDASHEIPDVCADVTTVLQLFPRALIMGDDWCWPTVRAGVRLAVAGLPDLGYDIIHSKIVWTLER